MGEREGALFYKEFLLVDAGHVDRLRLPANVSNRRARCTSLKIGWPARGGSIETKE